MKNTLQRGTEGAGMLDMSSREVLTGLDALTFLDNLNAAFCLTDGKFGRKVCDDQGFPIPGNYLDQPQPLNVAVANLRRNATVGILPGHSEGLTVLDIDAGKDSWIAANPEFEDAAYVFRDNGPDRLKFVILITDLGDKYQRQDAAEPTRKAELLGTRNHACVAGRHTSGSIYKLNTGRILVFTLAQIVEKINAWIPNPYKPEGERTQAAPHSSVLRPHQPLTAGDQLKPAIAWWNNDPANVSQVETLLSTCKGAGRYKAIRSERTPSATRTDTKDGFYKATWRDYGSNQTYDAYDMYCLLTGTDKTRHKWEVVNAWRVSQGLRPLELR